MNPPAAEAPAPCLTLAEVAASPSRDSFSVYAVVSKVYAGQQTATAAKRKTLTLVDASCPAGLVVSCVHNVFVQTQARTITPGNILRISRLSRDSSNSYSCDEASTTQIPSFEFDYENKQPESFAAQYFPNGDSLVVQRLEKWYAEEVLKWNFSSLTQMSFGQKVYVNFACQVVEQRATKRNINLTVWDGQQPGATVTDDFKSQYCDYIYGDSYARRNEDVFSLALPKQVFITVWKNESQSAIDHYRTCSTLDISGNGGLLLFLNAEVSSSSFGVSITMRSGHHQGKAVRVVKPSSVLGRLLNERLSDAVFTAEAEACEEWEDVSEQDVIQNAEAGVTLSKRALTPEETELIKRLPAHISLRMLLNYSADSLDSYERLILSCDEKNLTVEEGFGVGYGKKEVRRLLSIVRAIKNEQIEIGFPIK